MRAGLLVVMGVCVVSGQAFADGRIHDLSMTPNEMIQQNMHVNKPGVPITGGSNMTPAGTGQGWGTGATGEPITGAPENMPSNNYMTGYCDPNFKPMVSRNAQYATMAACLQQQREEACGLYKSAGADVRRAIDDSVNCAAQSMGGAEENEDGTLNFGAVASPLAAACGDADTRRLGLIKKYWSEKDTAYALVFVPDLVMDNSANCLKRR